MGWEIALFCLVYFICFISVYWLCTFHLIYKVQHVRIRRFEKYLCNVLNANSVKCTLHYKFILLFICNGMLTLFDELLHVQLNPLLHFCAKIVGWSRSHHNTTTWPTFHSVKRNEFLNDWLPRWVPSSTKRAFNSRAMKTIISINRSSVKAVKNSSRKST